MRRFYDPLTYRHPRTLAEIDADSMAWWASAESDKAAEQQLREQFAERAPRLRIVHFLPLGLVALAAIVLNLIAAA